MVWDRQKKCGGDKPVNEIPIDNWIHIQTNDKILHIHLLPIKKPTYFHEIINNLN